MGTTGFILSTVCLRMKSPRPWALHTSFPKGFWALFESLNSGVCLNVTLNPKPINHSLIINLMHKVISIPSPWRSWWLSCPPRPSTSKTGSVQTVLQQVHRRVVLRPQILPGFFGYVQTNAPASSGHRDEAIVVDTKP